MIPIAPQPLAAPAAQGLQALQDRVNAQPNYAQQVVLAKASWDDKPKALFNGIKQQLAAMCSGNGRCVYCEDSLADEIEHMRPKDLFPGQAYDWANYVLACGPCNGPKNNHFAVLSSDLTLIDITRKRGAPVVPPATGLHALIDPRTEDPLHLLWLDFRTWRYVPNTDDETSADWKRADYTINVLRLNQRDDLVRGRKSAYTNYLSRLDRWSQHHAQWSEAERQSFVDDFRAERYRGVWERMKCYRRELAMLAEVAALIERVPEALTW